jgi:hypothetical protein
MQIAFFFFRVPQYSNGQDLVHIKFMVIWSGVEWQGQNRSLEARRPRRRWEDNIKMDLQEK